MPLRPAPCKFPAAGAGPPLQGCGACVPSAQHRPRPGTQGPHPPPGSPIRSWHPHPWETPLDDDVPFTLFPTAAANIPVDAPPFIPPPTALSPRCRDARAGPSSSDACGGLPGLVKPTARLPLGAYTFQGYTHAL